MFGLGLCDGGGICVGWIGVLLGCGFVWYLHCVWEEHFVSVSVMEMVLLLMKKRSSSMNLRALLLLEWSVQENRGDTRFFMCKKMSHL